MKTSIQKIIQEIKTLEPIPRVTHHLLKVLENDRSSVQDIVKIIQYEPTVTTNLIRTCNTAYYGSKKPINSVKDAVTILGLNKVVDIVLYQAGRYLFGEINGYAEHEGVLWKLSISSALMTRQIAIKTDMPNKNMLFTAALIKDIGKTIMGRYVEGAAQKITKLVDCQNYSFTQAEKKVIGIDHAELGGMIANSWKFSNRMEELIRDHHIQERSKIDNKEYAAIYLADKLCMGMGLGGWIDRNDSVYYNEAMESVGITQMDLPEIIGDFSVEMQEVEDLLRVV